MNIKEFRQLVAAAMARAGFVPQRRPRTSAPIWHLPGGEVQRGFGEHAIRRPWGFLLSGALSVDLPAFRAWLDAAYPREQQGLMRGQILGRHIANDPQLFFGAQLEEEPPVDAWAALLRERLEALPTGVEGLIAAWLEQRDRLRPVWGPDDRSEANMKYLHVWTLTGEVPLPPPAVLPNGRLVETYVAELDDLWRSTVERPA